MINLSNVFIVSGAAGSGKDSVIDGLQTHLPIERVVTTTSRFMRPFESEGHPYYFISREEFEKGIARNEFIEHSINENGELYGVTRTELERVGRLQAIGIWRVDWKGVISIKKLYPNILSIYISAPLAVLEKRLRARDIGKEEFYFEERMAYTREWLNHLDIYDYIVENEEGKLAQTVEAVATIIRDRFRTKS